MSSYILRALLFRVFSRALIFLENPIWVYATSKVKSSKYDVSTQTLPYIHPSKGPLKGARYFKGTHVRESYMVSHHVLESRELISRGPKDHINTRISHSGS